MNSKLLPSAAGLDPHRMPAHVAIIMDGNGRWAQKRMMNRVRGHEQGANVVREIVTASRELGISALTLYAFSTENWNRPKSEITALMTLLKRFLKAEKAEMITHNIRFNTIGEIHRLPEDVRDLLEETLTETRSNSGMILTLALSYGGRDELVHMARRVAAEVAAGSLTPVAVTSHLIEGYLYTGGMKDPDLLIRTSGEMRISNFMLWQLAYAELFFTPTLWPDFSRAEYIDILKDYQQRERRFGQLTASAS